MYDTLLYKHNLTRSTAKEVEFKDGFEALKAFVFKKGNTQYLLPKEWFKNLPIRIKEQEEHTTVGNDVPKVITSYTSFKVNPEKVYSFRQLIDLDKTVHTTPDAYTLWKIICWASRIDRINIRVSSNPSWGKTSYYKVMNFIVDKSHVVTGVKSMPGLALNLTEDGVIVLDEMGNIPAEIKKTVQNGLYQLGEFSPFLTIGSAGSHAHKTKAKYDTPMVSCVCLFNNLDCYREENEFFDNMWSNSAAIKSRFMPLKLPNGEIDEEQFKGQAKVLNDEVRNTFRGIMKTVEWYKLNWTMDVNQEIVMSKCHNTGIKGRHSKSLLIIASFIYLYTGEDEQEFDKYLKLLRGMYDDYGQMVNPRDYLNLREESI